MLYMSGSRGGGEGLPHLKKNKTTGFLSKNSEYDQEIPQSQTADKPVTS